MTAQPNCAERVQDSYERTLAEFGRFFAPDADEETREEFYEYGLSFEYVWPDGEDGGFWRYLLSWGGPSSEIRFFGHPGLHQPWICQRIEYWFLDWFDGASVDCTDNETMRELFDWFADCEALQSAYDAAAREEE